MSTLQLKYSDFNIIGMPSEDFLIEVDDAAGVKKSGVFFTLLTNGLPGDPAFGAGMGELFGELNVDALATQLETRAAVVEDAVSGIQFRNAVVERIVEQQFIGADLSYLDTESRTELLIPVGFTG